MTTRLPKDMPARIEGAAAWYGPDLAEKPDLWSQTLAPAEVAELEAATGDFMARGGDLGTLTPAEFPLPTLGAKLRALRTDLIGGIGFRLVRGLPVSRYSNDQIAVMFCGIGTHVGSLRSQNAEGHLLGHVRDVGRDPNDAKARIYQTNARQTFHTDSSDAVALLCLREAMEGGASLLVSSVTIYNEISARAPELLPCLFVPIATDRRGEHRAEQDPYFSIPVFSWHKGELTSIYQRQYIDSAQRFDGAPRLTENHIKALDMFDALADDPRLHLSMRLQPGDMQFVYNHALLHDRTGFTDWPEPDQRRHLLRLWLSLPGDRPLPETFRQRYGDISIGARGGIVLESTKLKVPSW